MWTNTEIGKLPEKLEAFSNSESCLTQSFHGPTPKKQRSCRIIVAFLEADISLKKLENPNFSRLFVDLRHSLSVVSTS